MYLQTLLFYIFYNQDLLTPGNNVNDNNFGKDLTPFSIRWEDSADAIKKALEIPLDKLPTRIENYFVFADLPHGKFSNKKAKEQLGWQPKYDLKALWNRD